MGKTKARFEQLLVPAVAGILWILAGAANTWVVAAGQGRIPDPFAGLVFPPTLPRGDLQDLSGPAAVLVAAVAALVVGAFAAALLPVATRGSEARQRGPEFLAAWACMVLASVAGSGVLAVGILLTDWPPASITWALNDLQGFLLTGAYWGAAWGWLPALLAVRFATDPAGRAGTATSHFHWRPAAVFGAAAVALLGLVPAVTPERGLGYTPEPQAEATAEPVVFGAELVGPSPYDPDPLWCTGEEVRADVGGWDAATGHRGARVTVQNTGTRTCVVQAYPDLAFEDTDGWVMNIMPVHGGSFMTDDVSNGPVQLGPGETAAASIGWTATAGAGAARVGTLLVAPFPGTLRQELDADIDLVDPGYLAVTGWTLYDQAAQDSAASAG